MGLWEFLQQWRSGRLVAGIAASIVLHALLVLVVVLGLQLPSGPRWKTKPGDALIVELPKPDEPASAGSPNAPPPAPRMASAPVPAARPAPPAPKPEPPAPRRVASAPRAAEPPRPAPRAEAARTAEPAARAPEATTPEPAPSATASPTAPPDATPAEGAPHPEERQVASLPPAGAPTGPPVIDARSALRRGGGGRGGRGGIDGDPIALDSHDANFSEYLEKVRQQIKAKWNYPCVKNHTTMQCEYLSAQLVVEFGILKSGRLQYVDVVRSSGYAIYDDYAVNAIRLAEPYPPVPSEMIARMRVGSTGTVIGAHFNYITETSLTNIR
jgi:TonB family protein